MTDHTTTASLEALDQDYQSRLTLAASADAVFEALTTTEGLAGWWPPVTGDGLTNGELTFSFGPASQAVMRVDAAERGVGVRWTNLACIVEDWVGTTLHFDIEATPTGGTGHCAVLGQEETPVWRRTSTIAQAQNARCSSRVRSRRLLVSGSSA